MGMLWHHLDRTVDLEAARREPAKRQRKQVRRLADERLIGQMQRDVLNAVEAAGWASEKRNEIVHQDWVLRGLDAMRPVSEWANIPQEDWGSYKEEWERESKPSSNWQRVPSQS